MGLLVRFWLGQFIFLNNLIHSIKNLINIGLKYLKNKHKDI